MRSYRLLRLLWIAIEDLSGLMTNHWQESIL